MKNKNSIIILLLIGLVIGGALYYFKELRYTKGEWQPSGNVIIKGEYRTLNITRSGPGVISELEPFAVFSHGEFICYGLIGVPLSQCGIVDGDTVIITGVVTNDLPSHWQINEPIVISSIVVLVSDIHEPSWWE